MTGSITNHRIAKYAFGGLRLMVRYEADTYLAGDKGVEDWTNKMGGIGD
jgi:hypothetical protein